MRVVDGRARWSVTLPRARAGLLHLNAYVEGDDRDAAGTRAIRLVALAATLPRPVPIRTAAAIGRTE